MPSILLHHRLCEERAAAAACAHRVRVVRGDMEILRAEGLTVHHPRPPQLEEAEGAGRTQLNKSPPGPG
ncbi:hypothetical protein [Streptomyces sp.]|uniref:hypothetical protein n=1 Tax=Streptomyces sp. TaxID=1931 RepID=UPI002D41A659|nr:hypothetical protein [Streptomyces sp.]HZF90506.1 hypothetical protein [Streptomyces sp.]